MADLGEKLPQMRAAWITGGSALGHCPPDWRSALGEGPSAEVALAALAGQAMQVAYRPVAPGPLTPRPLLPTLEAPTAPAAVRPRVRRLLGKGEAGRARDLVQLLAARGYAMHPADWLPAPGDDWAPAFYAPWLTWAAAEKAVATAEALTIANYDDWPWAERRAELAALRRRDGAAALAIIAAKAAAEPAERRLKLLDILETGLDAADIPFLETLSGDRSDRVRAQAARLLARLGHGRGDAEQAAELAAMVELSKTGLIRRRNQLKLKALKTQAQENRRRELLGLVTLADLARALGASEAALTEAAPAGDNAAAMHFAEMVAKTGSESARQATLQHVLEDAGAPLGLVIPLAARATAAERADALPAVLARDTGQGFQVALLFAGDALGGVSMRALAAAPGYRAVGDQLRAAASDDDDRRTRADTPLRQALWALGLLLDAAAARGVIDTATAAGLSPADPRLDLLHLNAALNPERPT